MIVDTEIDELIAQPAILHQHLKNLGSNIVLLEEGTLTKLRHDISSFSELNTLSSLEPSLSDSFWLGSAVSFDSFGDVSSYGADFGGFDAGDFGRAGSGDVMLSQLIGVDYAFRYRRIFLLIMLS